MFDPVSRRVDRLDVSGIRKVFDQARAIKDPVNLSIGQPHFGVPEPVKEAMSRAVLDNRNAYTPTQGNQDLIDAVAADARARGLAFEDLIITSGVSGGLMLAFSALLDPGDEVVVADPYFLMYKQLARFLDARLTCVDTYPDFRLTAARLEPHLKRGPKLLVLNSPGNPTGVGLSPAEWKDLAGLLARHPDVTVISDEIYRLFHYAPEGYTSFAALRGNVITLDGFSKSHAMTGLRVGWAAGPRRVIQQMAKLQQFTFVCAPAPAQKAALAALGVSMERERLDYAAKRDRVYEGLRGLYEVERPQGTFYIFPRVPAGYTDGQDFCARALERKMLVIPGDVFSERCTHIRISFANTDEMLDRGLAILRDMAGGR